MGHMKLDKIESCRDDTPGGIDMLLNYDKQILFFKVCYFLSPPAPCYFQEMHDLNTYLRLRICLADSIEQAFQAFGKAVVANSQVVRAPGWQHDRRFNNKRAHATPCFPLSRSTSLNTR